VLGFEPQELQRPEALVLMLVSSFILEIGTLLMLPLKGLGMVSQQGWTAIIGLLPLLALSAVLEPGGAQALRDASWIGWGGAAYSALFSSLLGHGLYYVLVQRHPVAQVTPWLLLSPVLAVILGIAFWGDRPGPQLWIGGAMVLGGVLLIALRGMAKSRPVAVAEPL
jgi:O-acetylserine/cysteine efflux transporter